MPHAPKNKLAWRPSADIVSLKKRAQILAHIRAFFDARGLYEVETPALSRGTVTDPFIDGFSLQSLCFGENTTRYLQTSPEYAMKRLLAAGSGDIYQICKAFRNDEIGQYHNPEFTILEWYRSNFDMQDLINEVSDLLCMLLGIPNLEQTTYQHLFLKYCQFDPLQITAKELMKYATHKGHLAYLQSLQKQGNSQSHIQDSLLQMLFYTEIEPNIGQIIPMVVTHFPAAQSALATMSEDGLSANRFEVYFKSIELANGFNELTDAKEQRQRFEQDNVKRNVLGKAERPIDSAFIAALDSGLPPCSGVALGIDRLIMLLLGKTHIKQVISFDNDNA
ncbi:elongation factor P--(R)-beta-lysine ligase [Glaciecola petra]|uniref:Elongation factor P--(R)-beta-lysine ligase n=1 Tax=Glaciecola petra TaxID=3075602 RepID=A0ABU2ZL72_9ALTE|nr:elongation factor P--(R)-beta-lysine ligase [Aestuariibacter sp. P117]MDT0593373.1 elongation factor P--(R)-beta-lysine ligase [Aestuariibacter sp. P117]